MAELYTDVCLMNDETLEVLLAQFTEASLRRCLAKLQAIRGAPTSRQAEALANEALAELEPLGRVGGEVAKPRE